MFVLSVYRCNRSPTGSYLYISSVFVCILSIWYQLLLLKAVIRELMILRYIRDGTKSEHWLENNGHDHGGVYDKDEVIRKLMGSQSSSGRSRSRSRSRGLSNEKRVTSRDEEEEVLLNAAHHIHNPLQSSYDGVEVHVDGDDVDGDDVVLVTSPSGVARTSVHQHSRTSSSWWVRERK